MSRGSRGGGRGGRGGRGGGGANGRLPWDTGDEPDGKPSELFPPYAVPVPRSLTETEKSSVHHFLLLRHQLHASPLYTSKRTFEDNPLMPKRMYDQVQANVSYGSKNKASQDPFTSMPLYSQRFIKEERALPDWSRRPVCRELFPRELLEVVEPEAARGKRRKLELSKVSALPNAEEAFGLVEAEEGEYGEAGKKNLLDRLEAMGEGDGDAGDKVDDEEGAGEEPDEDLEYDDSDAGDYDAENYFDNGDDYGDDHDGGDDGEGTF